MKIIKIQIHVAQNVSKVWIDRKKTFPTPFGATPYHFFHGPKKTKTYTNRSKGSLRRIWSLGALGEGSGWDLRIRPPPAAAWRRRRLEMWEPGNLGIWRSGDLEIQKFGVQKHKKWKFSKSKTILPKMSARSGLVGNKSSWPYLGPSQEMFVHRPENTKTKKMLPIFLGGPMGPIHPVWALAAIHPVWGNR